MDPLTLQPRQSQRDNQPTAQPTPAPRCAGPEPEQNESFVLEVFKFSVLALLIVVPFRLFVAQPFIVSGASMSPTFETGEYLIVDQVSYHFDAPQRGDVVIFKFPNDPSKYFIKRIVGLPGEVVELANGTTTIIDPATNAEVLLEEPYLQKDRTDDHLTITLSADEFFVMGDNRGASSDSRMWGPVPRDNIVGRAYLRLLPVNGFGVLPGAYLYSTGTAIDQSS